jgi:hypothetical protein
MRRSLVAGVVAVGGCCSAALAAPDAAGGHGPCACVFPVIARPGTVVTTTNAYRIVLNPPARFFRGGAGPPELASGYRPEAPTTEVFRRRRPAYGERAPKGRFRVPGDTPPGIYLLLIFDGGEGGTHATWDYLHVPDPPLDPADGEWHEVIAALVAVLPPL